MSAAYLLAGLVLAPFAFFIGSCALRRVEPVLLPKLAAFAEIEVLAPGAPSRALAALAERSSFLYALIVRNRVQKARYSGLAQYEEWAFEIVSIPSCPARRALMAEINRYKPSLKLIGRARALRGRLCAEVRREESKAPSKKER